MPLTIKNKFGIGQFVYLVHDPDQVKRMVISIQVNANGLLYVLTLNGDETFHFEIELSDTPSIVDKKD